MERILGIIGRNVPKGFSRLPLFQVVLTSLILCHRLYAFEQDAIFILVEFKTKKIGNIQLSKLTTTVVGLVDMSQWVALISYQIFELPTVFTTINL